jgi:hypothetical protein
VAPSRSGEAPIVLARVQHRVERQGLAMANRVPSYCTRTWYAGDAEDLVAALKGLLEAKSVAAAGGTKSPGA